MKPLIRPMQPEDIPVLAQMEKEIFSMPWSEKCFAELLERPYCLYLVAQEDCEVVGCAGLVALGEEGDVDKVMVAEAFRGRGIAMELMRELLLEGEKRGIRDFTLEVRAGNAAAIALYTKLGFRSEGVRPGFYERPAEDALIMWRRQDAPDVQQLPCPQKG